MVAKFLSRLQGNLFKKLTDRPQRSLDAERSKFEGTTWLPCAVEQKDLSHRTYLLNDDLITV